MARDTVYVFTRAPRLGTGKTRLARGIGQRGALRFHVATLHRLVRALARERRFRTVLAVTPDGGHVPGLRGVARVAQGQGDLGVRMARLLDRNRRGRAVVIGSDIPAAESADVVAAFRVLGRADAVFGPAADGGYWLVGVGPRRVSGPFEGVAWSTERTLAETLARFGHRRVGFLRTLRDVDTAADLPAIRRP